MNEGKNGWLCTCGNMVDSHLLTCPKCKRTLRLDKVVTGSEAEAPAPPIEQWIREQQEKRTYSQESMNEIMAQAKKRDKQSRKGGKRQPLDSLPQTSQRSMGAWLITLVVAGVGLSTTALVGATNPPAAGWVTYMIIGATSVISSVALKNGKILVRYINSAQLVRTNREYYRLLSSGALHAHALHLIVNMYTLYSFGPVVEAELAQFFPTRFSSTIYLSFYLSAILLGNLPSYLRYRNLKKPFSSLGASGAVCAVIGATVLMNPRATILIMGVLPVNAFVFFIGFLVVSHLLYRRAVTSDRVGGVDHIAHITGAIYGFLIMAAFAYSAHIDPIANFLHPNL